MTCFLAQVMGGMPPLGLLLLIALCCAGSPLAGLFVSMALERRPSRSRWIVAVAYYGLLVPPLVMGHFNDDPEPVGFAAAMAFTALLPVGLCLCL